MVCVLISVRLWLVGRSVLVPSAWSSGSCIHINYRLRTSVLENSRVVPRDEVRVSLVLLGWMAMVA